MVVINIKDAPVGWEKNPKYAYIGRSGKGIRGKFGNPYEKNCEGDAIELYEKYLSKKINSDEKFLADFSTLRNKILVCFCKPKRCHGDIIIKYLEKLYGW